MRNNLKQLFNCFPDKQKRFSFPLSQLATIKTGGEAALVFSAASESDIMTALNICRKHGINHYILGYASNVLASDKGYDGVIIRIAHDFAKYRIEDNIIYADSGCGLISLSRAALAQGLSGLEFAAGIPGTIGGAVVMNAGAYGGEIADIVGSVTVLENSRLIKLDKDSCEFGYRKSRFSDGGQVVFEVALCLKTDNPDSIEQRMEDFNLRRRQHTPIGQPSAGSAFKRPKNAFAAELIERAGLKGKKIGGAMVSDIHSGFIVNTGGATSKDVYNLLEFIKIIVYNKFGTVLEPEIKLVGDFN